MKQLVKIALITLISCSSLSKKDCINMNWKNKGVKDAHSKTSWKENLGNYKEQCSEHKIKVNEAAYTSGIKYEGAKICSDLQSFHIDGWQEVGKRDALEGQSKIDYHNKCLEYGVIPVNSLYETGYNRGLEVFCSADRAYEFGLSGGVYNYQCPKHLEAEFLRHHTAGIKVFETKKLERRVVNLENEIDSLHATHERKEKELYETESDLRELEIHAPREIADIEAEIYSVKRKIDVLRRDYSNSSIKPIGSSQLSSLESRLRSLESDLSSEKSAYLREREDYLRDIQDLNDDLNDIDQSIRNANIDLSNLRRRLHESHMDAKDHERNL